MGWQERPPPGALANAAKRARGTVFDTSHNGRGRSNHPGRWALGCVDNDTVVTPPIPKTRAAAGLRSITRPRTKGPRSLIRTTAERPLPGLTTVTLVPKGMGRRHCARVHVLSGRSVLAAVHRGDARIIERAAGLRRMARLLAGEVGCRQQLVTHAVPVVARWCIATHRVVRLFSVRPRLPTMSMRGSGADAGPGRHYGGQSSRHEYISKDTLIWRFDVTFQRKFLPSPFSYFSESLSCNPGILNFVPRCGRRC
jgi:hypothetical protein